MLRRTLVAALALLGATAALATTAPPATAASYPVSYDYPSQFALGLALPDVPPPGANDWSCRPSAAHPEPVVLVHGTIENQHDNWRALSPVLANAGYCVFTANFGGLWYTGPFKGLDHVATSAQQLKAFVAKVRAATGAAKVDIVGHSQGGMMPRYYLRELGGAPSVDQLVGITPSNHGTTLSGLALLAEAIPGVVPFGYQATPAFTEQIVGSPFLTALNAGGETVPGVRYTVITTTHDEVVTPHTSGYLSGPDVTNLTVQDRCPNDPVGHLGAPYDRYVIGLVLQALDPSAPTPACTLGFPL